jgi:hypothetical protein
MVDPVMKEIESILLHLYSLPHNKIVLQKNGKTPELAVKEKLEEIRTGFLGTPEKKEFLGPKLFLRVVGPGNRVYSGEWWFDADQLNYLEQIYSRIYFNSADRNTVIQNILREILAISKNWPNTLQEVWLLELPASEKLLGFSGIVAPQRLFGNIPLTQKGNRMLVGRARQFYFPVKNPLWIKKYGELG